MLKVIKKQLIIVLSLLWQAVRVLYSLYIWVHTLIMSLTQKPNMELDANSKPLDGQAPEHTDPEAQSTWGRLYGETKHYLGGLITHPTESNKHFTILRHSHGIVFWRGPTTTVALTVYSEEPLPADRTYWLQCKGFSGKTGMKVKGMFEWMRRDWLGMTPTTKLTADQLDPDDERAWQRDMHALETGKNSGLRASHTMRETVILRVPAVAEDGYYCVVLCRGEHSTTLCTSPAFRLMSASTNPSSLRGASLTSLPFEIGVLVASNTAKAMGGYATNPLSGVVSRVPLPDFVTKKALGTAYTTALGKRGDKNNKDDMKRSLTAPISSGDAGLNLETGPTRPFPIAARLGVQIPQDPSTSSNAIQYPGIRLDLVNPPGNIFNQLSGHYISWSRVVRPPPSPKDGQQQQQQPPEAGPWNRSIISVSDIDPSTLPRVTMQDALQRVASLHVLDLNQYGNPANQDQKIDTEKEKGQEPIGEVDIRILCPLRPLLAPPAEASPATQSDDSANDDKDTKSDRTPSIDDFVTHDVDLTNQVLDNPAWSPEIKPRTTAGGLPRAETFGLRTPSSIERDSHFVTRGFYVPR